MLLPFVLIVVNNIMVSHGKGRVPWSAQLRRMSAGLTQKAEWMAPDTVVHQVRSDYLAALEWLHDSALKHTRHQWAYAPLFLSGAYLKRHQRILRSQREAAPPRLVGILRSDHVIEVRHFSEDGESCLVIDHQEQRRMATYDFETRTRLHTQDVGACTLVYQMVYDLSSQRWKIAAFVQQLPLGWGSPKLTRHIRVLAQLPSSARREN